MRFAAGPSWDRLLLALLVLLGAAEAVAVYMWNPGGRGVLFQLYHAILTAAIIVHLGRPRRPIRLPSCTASMLLAGTFIVTLVVAHVVLQAYPNSGDEYGYTYVTDTLLHGDSGTWPTRRPCAMSCRPSTSAAMAISACRNICRDGLSL